MMLKKLLYLLLPCVLVQACTEKIAMDLEVMPTTPVVSGIVSNEEQWVRLSTTSGYLNGEGTAISGADVTVADGERVYAFRELPEEKGLYRPIQRIMVHPNREYKLNVQADFVGDGIKQEYTASSTVAPTPMLDSITMQVMRSFDDLFWFIQINYQDVPHENSYLCRVFVNDMLDVGLTSYNIYDNRYGYGDYIEHKLIAVLYERPFSDEKVQIGDRVKVSFSGIAKDYFSFLYSAQNETGGRNPIFSGPPANVKGNISNGALGIFTAYQTSWLAVTITDIWR